MASFQDHIPRQSSTLIARHFSGGRRDSVERWDRERIRAYQLEALNDLLGYVHLASRFYRDKLRGAGFGGCQPVTAGDFANIPLTTRAEIARDPWALVTQPTERLAEIFSSTGTTGDAELFVAHSYEDLFVRDLAPDLPVLIPLAEADIVVNALPYETSSAGLSFHRVFVHGAGAVVVPAGKDGCYSDPLSASRLIEKLSATAAITSPSYLARMVEVSGGKLPWRGRLKRVWLTGEACSNSWRTRLEDEMGSPAYLFYGSLECGVIGIECDSQDGFHIACGHVLVEVIGDDGRILASGEVGEIVVTVLLRRATPLIRYRTGDVGYVDDVPCRCGIALPRLFLRGRHGDQVSVGGEQVSPIYIEEMLLRNPEVSCWYRIIDGTDPLRIEVMPRVKGSLAGDAEARVSSRVEYLIGASVKVEVVERLPLEPGKVRRVQRLEGKL